VRRLVALVVQRHVRAAVYGSCIKVGYPNNNEQRGVGGGVNQNACQRSGQRSPTAGSAAVHAVAYAVATA